MLQGSLISPERCHVGDLEKFCEFLYGDQKGIVGVGLLADAKMDHSFYQWPEEKDSLYKTIRSNAPAFDVYIIPSLLKLKRASKVAFEASQVIWADFDGVTPVLPEGVPEPGMMVQTSTNDHIHAYWRIPRSENAEFIESQNKALAYGLHADISGWDITQLLRPPETINHKNGLEVKLLYAQPQAPFTSLNLPEIYKTPEIRSPGEIPDPTEVFKKLSKNLLKEVKEATVYFPSRSEFLMAMGHKLAEFGLSFHDVISLVAYIDLRVGKFTERQDRLERYAEIASVAINKLDPTELYEWTSPLDILNFVEDVEYIWEGVLHTTGFLFISGQPGVGKTQLALDMMHAFATKRDWIGIPVVKECKVGFFTLEMSFPEIKEFLKQQVREFEEIGTLEKWGANLALSAAPSGDLDTYWRLLQEKDFDVVFIDSLSEMALEDLKENEARQLIRWINKVRRELGVAVVVIHHNRKASEGNKKPKSLSDLYGSFMFAAKAESVAFLWDNDPNSDEKSDLELLFPKARLSKQKSVKISRTVNLTFKLQDEVKDDDRRHPPEVKADGRLSLDFRGIGHRH
jgi:archaellum biogenesis ATPase FlaH